MMSHRISIALAVLLPIALASPQAVVAQTNLSSGQIISSLQGLNAAPSTLTAAALHQLALDHIRDYPGNDPKNIPPLSIPLSSLPQLTVEVTFDLGSAAIRPESYKTLGYIADALHHPLLLGSKILIVGHTDARGERKFNLELSQKRADAIREVLVTTFRIAPSRVTAVGLGEEQFRDPAHPYSAVNRRVQLINIGGS
jgi:OOP family OmpA-OmpF porin